MGLAVLMCLGGGAAEGDSSGAGFGAKLFQSFDFRGYLEK